MPDIRAGNISGVSGLMVAADVPARHLPAAMAGKLEPVKVLLHDKERDTMIELPVRPITSEEAVMLINRYLQEGKIEFGFRKKEQNYGGPIA